MLLADRLANEPLDGGELWSLLGCGQCDRVATAPGASCAANAVHVVIGHMREIEVDHVADVVDVDAPGGDIGRDERVDGSRSEPMEGPRARGLALVGVNRSHAASGLLEVLHELVGPRLRAREDERLPHVFSLQQRLEEVLLAVRHHWVYDLPNLADRGRPTRDLDHHWFPRRTFNERLDLVWHRGREKEVLALGWEGTEYPADVGEKAHVEHPVGLIEDHHLDAA